MIDDARPGRRIDARVQAHPAQVGAQLVDRHLAALACSAARVASSRSSVRDLAAQLVVAVVEIRDEHRELLRRQPGEGRAARLGPKLDDDEQAQDERHGRDGQLVATAGASVSRPASARLPGDGCGRA